MGALQCLGTTLERWFLPAGLADPAHPGAGYARRALPHDDSAVHAEHWPLMAGHDVRDRLAGLAIPVSVIAAAQDRSVPVARMRDLAAGIRRARLEILPGPHILPLSAPAPFRDAVLRHVQAVRGRGSLDDGASTDANGDEEDAR